MSFGARRERRPTTFYLLTIALSIPFLVVGGLTGKSLLPGLPVAGLMGVCPGIAATILAWRDGGWVGARALWRSLLDVGRVKHFSWYLPVLLFAPIQFAFAFEITRLLGLDLPPPTFDTTKLFVLCLFFFIGAAAEECGWTGYATEDLVERCGGLGAGIVLGLGWSAFHYVALMEAHRSATWIAWWTLWTVAQRIAMVCMFNARA